MTMTGGASLGPCLERLVETFNAIPIKESSGVEEDDRKGAYDDHHRQIDIAPGLLCRSDIRNAT